MRKSPFTKLKYLITISLAIFLLGGEPTEFGSEKTFFHGYLIQKPIIRIGLGVNLEQMKISASSGMKIYEVKTNYKLIANDVDEVLLRGQKEKLNEKYVIQIAQAKEREKAEIIAQDVKTWIDHKVFVEDSSEAGSSENFKILVGDFITRGDALSYIVKLNRIGIQDTWILRKEITGSESKPLWILVNDEMKSLDNDTILYFIPSNPQSYLSYKGRDYRGILTLRATRKGIVIINTLNLEDYLKAVVPSELSPYNFPELEAHKAQAVAARTYAIKNLGKENDLGFDISDTPQAQFYKGMKAEHPLSTRAVEETKGEVALYRGKLINALYTSTCGGQTENVENVFLGPSLPYLRATECVYEKQNEWRLTSQANIPEVIIEGQDISHKIAELISLDVLSPETSPDFYYEEIKYQEAQVWVSRAQALLGKKTDSAAGDDSPMYLESFVELAIQAFDWKEGVENLLLESEKEFILGDGQNWANGDKGYLAYLIQTGVISSAYDYTNPQRILIRGEMVDYLWKILRNYHDFSVQGKFKRLSEEALTKTGTESEADTSYIEVEVDQEMTLLSFNPHTYLVKNYGGRYSFESEILLLGGEKVRWIASDGRLQLLEVIYPPYSNILDRSSLYHSWHVRKSREELTRRIQQYYPIGELEDITCQKRGDSHRVIELLVKGDQNQSVVKGLRVRRVLGLRETLFVIDREFDEDGRITHFTFRGKGWGHGVGLCQVGAFGMAQTGAGYKDILKKYYRGISIKKIL